jgi:hypothetical protein
MLNHLENLIKQFYEWRGYIVRNNVKVGKLKHGGWEMELDIVAYNPADQTLIQIESSVDAHSWATRETRFRKKFAAGRKYICKDVFPWVQPDTAIEQIAVLVSSGRRELAGGKVVTVDELMKTIRTEIAQVGIMGKHAIPEHFDLLRTIQLVVCGYYKAVK